MSFSGTPLGQGRRLDRITFLNKPPSIGPRPPSPNRLVPPSYTHGTLILESRSPQKPSSPGRDHNTSTHEDDENDSALTKFARYKQREQASLSSRPGGPRTITTPPDPETWSVKDTTVNIASAFYQAATDMNTATNPNASWASGSNRTSVPRSTSVEYETQTQASMTRRLAAPQNRLSRNAVPHKPVSKSSTSLRHVPDSEEEEERPSENGRGKSPFEQIVNSAKRVFAPASYYLQQRTGDLGESSTETLAPIPKDPSYEYTAEEADYQNKSARRGVNATHKRNRMSEDNKAYKPGHSDGESSDKDEDEKKGRKKKKKLKKDSIGGPLTSLPVIQPDRRRPKRSKGNKGAGADEEDDQSGSEDLTTNRRSAQHASVPLRNSIPPPIRQPSLPRRSVPPEPNDDDLDTSMDIEQALDSIPEVDEDQVYDTHLDYHQRSISRPPSSRIGGPLGHVVNFVARTLKASALFVIQILTTLLYFFGRVFGTIVDIILRRPVLWISRFNPSSHTFGVLMKFAILGFVLSAGYMLRNPVMRYMSGALHGPIYYAPDIPAASVTELAARLQRIENALSGITLDAEKGRKKAENDAKSHLELVGRLGTLENKVLTESKRALELQIQDGHTAREGLKVVRQEIEVLQAQIQQRPSSKTEMNKSDEEARAMVKALEERVGHVEGGVKEALEASKKAGSEGPGTGAAWWNRATSGSATKLKLTIKSTDGKDVTSLISHLVDSAVATHAKDTLARPDFALHSGGARIIPSLTSPTFEIRPTSLKSQFLGLLTGNGYAIGRPPVTALHHELHNGHCWPFAGSEGQLAVALAAPTYITDISIDHVAQEVAFDMRSAPRDVEVWGMVEGEDNVSKVKEWMTVKARRREEVKGRSEEVKERSEEVKERGEEAIEEPEYPRTLPKSPQYVRIANFSYDIHAPQNVQTFPISHEIRDLGVDFGIVVLMIKNNWGREDFTCLYRMRVHGLKMGETLLPYGEEKT